MDEFPFLSGRSADRWFLSEYARLLPGEAYASAAETPFDLPPEEWTPGYADFASACSGVM